MSYQNEDGRGQNKQVITCWGFFKELRQARKIPSEKSEILCSALQSEDFFLIFCSEIFIKAKFATGYCALME